jgi:hypothetical protein
MLAGAIGERTRALLAAMLPETERDRVVDGWFGRR